MFSISFIYQAFVIKETLGFCGQLNIICSFLFQLKYLLSFMSCNISTCKFRGLKIMVPWTVLNRCEKKVLLWNIVDVWEELMVALKELLAVVYIIVEDIIFFWFNQLLASILS